MVKLPPILVLAVLAGGWLTLPLGEAQVPPNPVPAAWIVADHVIVDHDVIEHYGEIMIVDGGTLELRDSTIVMQETSGYEPRIVVTDGGTLFLNGTSKEASKITSAEVLGADPLPPWTTFYYRIEVQEGGRMIGHNCDLSGFGINPELGNAPLHMYNMGLLVDGVLELTDCAIHDTRSGIRARNTAEVLLTSIHAFRNRQLLLMSTATKVIIHGMVSEGDSISIWDWDLAELRGVAFVPNAYERGPGLDFSRFVRKPSSAAIVSNVSVVGSYEPALNVGLVPVLLDGLYVSGSKTGIQLVSGSLVASHVNIWDTNLAVSVERDLATQGGNYLRLENSSLSGTSALWWVDNSTIRLRNVEASNTKVVTQFEGPKDFVWEASYRLRVMDGQNGSVSGVPVSFVAPNVAPVTAVTDAEGVVDVWLPVGFAPDAIYRHVNPKRLYEVSVGSESWSEVVSLGGMNRTHVLGSLSSSTSSASETRGSPGVGLVLVWVGGLAAAWISRSNRRVP